MTHQSRPDMVQVSFTSEQLELVKREVTGGAPYASRLSFAFVTRLAKHRDDMPAVLEEIDALEGLRPASRPTKEVEQFKHPPLFPLWHKHFFASRHVLRNTGDRWGISRGQGNRDLDALLTEIATKYGDDPSTWQGKLAERFTVDGLFDRADAGRLTGDWIIFGKHGGKNYYLDLAIHEEGRGLANAERLMHKLQAGSQAEFPFLFDDSGLTDTSAS